MSLVFLQIEISMGNIHDIYFDNLLYYPIAKHSEIFTQFWTCQPWERLRCTLSSKRNAFFQVAFLLEKSVYQ